MTGACPESLWQKNQTPLAARIAFGAAFTADASQCVTRPASRVTLRPETNNALLEHRSRSLEAGPQR